MNKKKLLVTGSTGFIGKNLLQRLRGYDIIAPRRQSGFDICDEETFPEEKVDSVIHLAGISRGTLDSEMGSTNVLGTRNVLKFCKQHGVKHIFMSTGAVYHSSDLPITEDGKVNPRSFYAATKLVGEDICRRFDVDSIILRVGNVYGPGQQEGYLIPNLIDPRKRVVTNPFPMRDYVFIDDVVSALIKSLDYEGSGTFNIGLGVSHSVGKIYELVTGKKLSYSGHKDPKDNILLDVSKARHQLNWLSKINIREGIKRTKEYGK